MYREHTQAPHANAVAITSITRRGTIPAQQLIPTATRLHKGEAPCSNTSVCDTLACQRSCFVSENRTLALIHTERKGKPMLRATAKTIARRGTLAASGE